MKIGGWFKDCDKIQKSVRKDPHPEIPFCDTRFPFPSVAEVGVATAIVLMVSTLIWLI